MSNEEEIRSAIEQLTDPDDFIKLEAENTIAMYMPESLEILHEEVVKKEYSKKKKLAMVEILKTFKDPSSIDVFATLLHDQNKWVRRESSSALSEYGDVAIETLVKLSDDPNWRARGGAVWALSKIADPKTINVFIKASKDEKSFVRSGSVFGLGAIRTDESKEILKELLDDESGYIQYNAKEFLNEFEKEHENEDE